MNAEKPGLNLPPLPPTVKVLEQCCTSRVDSDEIGRSIEPWALQLFHREMKVTDQVKRENETRTALKCQNPKPQARATIWNTSLNHFRDDSCFFFSGFMFT